MPCELRWLVALVVAVSLQAAGCSSNAPVEAPVSTGPTAKESLENMVLLLQHFKDQNQKTPARIEDVEPVDPVFPGAYLGLVRKEIVYVWGAPLNPAGSDRVLAYESTAPTDGGWVLMQDGTVKQMTQEQFSAAPKARP